MLRIKKGEQYFNIVNFSFQDDQEQEHYDWEGDKLDQIKYNEKGAKVEVCFSLVRSLGAAGKRHDTESRFKPIQKSCWLKFLQIYLLG